MFMYSVKFQEQKQSNFYGLVRPTTGHYVFEGGKSEKEVIDRLKSKFGDDIEVTEIHKTGNYESELKKLTNNCS